MYWVTVPLPNTLLPQDGVICHVTDSVSEKKPSQWPWCQAEIGLKCPSLAFTYDPI